MVAWVVCRGVGGRWRVFAAVGKADSGLVGVWEADGYWFLMREWHSAGEVLWVLGA